MIHLEKISKIFPTGSGEVRAVREVSLDIKQGEIFGIIGFSGAGKSTLVRCINLLERPTEGTVTVDGTELTGLDEKQLREVRRKIGMIFQHFNLLRSRTVYDNIAFPLKKSKLSKEEKHQKISSLLELVGLSDKKDAYPSQLSGGQKQRVAIARALANDPKVLLCDEATSALDPNTTHSILQLIQQINRELGITVVVITHQMSVVEDICRHVAILDGGRVVEQGDVAEIFSNPKTDAARRLVFPAGAPRSEGDLLPGRRMVRVAFNGTHTTDKPLVASLAIECSALVSIVAADTRVVNGQTLGSMLLALPEDEAAAQRAIEYIRAYPGLSFEEVDPA